MSKGCYLQFDVRLPTDGYVGADVGVVLVFLQEVVVTDENLPQPFEYLRVVDDLVLYQFL